MSSNPTALLTALLLVVALLVGPATAAAFAPRQLLRLQGAPTPDQQVTAMAKFRSAEAALLKQVTGGEAAMALSSTSPQYPEYEPLQDLRNSMIVEALSSVKASPPKPEECADSFALSRQLGIPETALAVYG
ncbi:hypothetical protein COO60DRAFT_1458465 [Scenedesmus sp. NREL 46B-D3]|nr:hypothetical protein COO60DRAFT_1458465 [Scenedesmus sp. NREL 46B-D3]